MKSLMKQVSNYYYYIYNSQVEGKVTNLRKIYINEIIGTLKIWYCSFQTFSH